MKLLIGVARVVPCAVQSPLEIERLLEVLQYEWPFASTALRTHVLDPSSTKPAKVGALIQRSLVPPHDCERTVVVYETSLEIRERAAKIVKSRQCPRINRLPRAPGLGISGCTTHGYGALVN